MNPEGASVLVGFGFRLREERERLQLSQEAFGALCDVGRVAQANYEHGNRSPSVGNNYFLDKLGVDVPYVLWGDREPNHSVGNGGCAPVNGGDAHLVESCVFAVGERLQRASGGGLDVAGLARMASLVYGRAALRPHDEQARFVEDMAAITVEMFAGHLPREK